MNKDSIKEFFDSIAPKWDNEPIADKKILDVILDNAGIRENIDILDVACGTGVLFPYYLHRNVKSITAIDLSPEMVKIAKSKFPQANVICGDAEKCAGAAVQHGDGGGEGALLLYRCVYGYGEPAGKAGICDADGAAGAAVPGN